MSVVGYSILKAVNLLTVVIAVHIRNFWLIIAGLLLYIHQDYRQSQELKVIKGKKNDTD